MKARNIYLTLLVSSLQSVCLNYATVQATINRKAPVRVEVKKGETTLTDQELRRQLVKSVENLEAAERKFYQTEVGIQMKKARDKVKQGWETVKDKAADAYEGAKEKVGNAYEQAKEKTRGVIPRIKETMRNIAHKVGIGKRKIVHKKDELANKAHQEWHDVKRKAQKTRAYQDLQDAKYRSKKLLRQYLDKGGNVDELVISLPTTSQERVRCWAENK